MTAPPDRQQAVLPPPPPRRPRPVLRILLALSVALFTLLATVVTLPDLLFGLDRRIPFAQLVSLRPLTLGAVSALLILLVIIGYFRRAVVPFVAATAVIVLAGVVMVVPRTIADPLPTTGTPLTVLSFNVWEGRADVDAFAALIRTSRPDVVAIPEGGRRYAARLAPLIEPLGYHLHYTRSTDSSDVANVAAAVSTTLGDVDVEVSEPGARLPYIQVTGGSLGALRWVAYHSAAPVPYEMAQWRSDLAAISRWCAGPTPAIVAGDFNSTLDHSALREGMAGCTDAADQRGAGLTSTWGPSAGTRAFGPQIDHVLGTAGIAAESFSVETLPRSDHRAILARLRVS